MNFSKRYGWHFPELGKIITDNLAFVRTVELMGTRENAKSIDLSDVLPEEVEEKVKEAAEISMGTEISEEDIINIKHLCQQVVEIQESRGQLYEYLKKQEPMSKVVQPRNKIGSSEAGLHKFRS